MRTYLRHGVYMCLVDEGAILLDSSANAYLGVDAATKDALTRHLVGLCPTHDAQTAGVNCRSSDGLAELLRRGLLTDSESVGRPFAPPAVAIAHSVPFGAGRSQTSRIGVTHLVRFVVSLTHASIMIRRGQLSALISRLTTLAASLPIPSRTAPWQDAVTLVHIFRRLATLFYTSRNACLLDSFVLAEFLIRHGHGATLVLGVRTKPFFAHAWVQVGDCVLNDTLEHAQTLTPIAAI